jgi:LemA protein
MSRSFAKFSRAARIALVVPLLTLFLAGCGVNNIPTYQELAKAKWSDVLNQYQRRSDLVPNLVETVKGIAQQERTVFEAVTEARAKATSVQVNADTITDPEAFKKFQEAQAQLSGALGRLLAVSENYPDLKSSQNFLTLQSQLEGTENRIAPRTVSLSPATTISRPCVCIIRNSAPSPDGFGPPSSIGATSRWRNSPWTTA